MSPWMLGLRNVFRNKRRTGFTLVSIVVGVAAIVLFDAFKTYTLWGLRESTIRNGVGHLQISTDARFFSEGTFDPFAFLLDDHAKMARKLKSIPAVKEVVPQIGFAGTLGMGDKSGIVVVEANPTEGASSAKSFRNMLDGRDLGPGDRRRVVLGKGVREKMNAKVGDTMTLMAVTKGGGINAVDVEVIGVCASGLGERDNIMVYLDLDSAMEFLSVRSVPLLIVVLEKTEYTEEAKIQIERAFAGKAPIAVKRWIDIAAYYRQVSGFYGALLSIIRLIIVLVVIFTIGNTMTMTVFERIREIGTLRAIGAKRQGVLTMFIAEGLWIGLLGGVLGVLLGAGLSLLLNATGGVTIPPPPGMSQGYQAYFKPTLAAAAENIGLSVLVAGLASIYPAIKAVRLHIAETLRFI
jgi:putative ABC transport system permease protein